MYTAHKNNFLLPYKIGIYERFKTLEQLYNCDRTNIAKQKVDFLKWCLVTMFGYQAFKNRKIGVIETHESIQAYAREILLNAVRTLADKR